MSTFTSGSSTSPHPGYSEFRCIVGITRRDHFRGSRKACAGAPADDQLERLARLPSLPTLELGGERFDDDRTERRAPFCRETLGSCEQSRGKVHGGPHASKCSAA